MGRMFLLSYTKWLKAVYSIRNILRATRASSLSLNDDCLDEDKEKRENHSRISLESYKALIHFCRSNFSKTNANLIFYREVDGYQSVRKKPLEDCINYQLVEYRIQCKVT